MKQTPPLVGLGVIPWDSIPLGWNLGLVNYFFFLESFCITILTLVLIIVTSCLAGSAAISAKDLKYDHDKFSHKMRIWFWQN